MYSGLNEEDSQCGSLMTGINSDIQYPISDSQHLKLSKSAKVPHFTQSSLSPGNESIMTAHAYVLKQKSTNADLSALHTVSTSMSVEKAITEVTIINQHPPQQKYPITDTVEIEGTEALAIQTVSMHVVKRKQAKKNVRSFIFNIFFLLTGILLLGMLIVFIAVIPDLIYKIEIFIIILVGSSYFASAEAKCIYRERQQRYLTATQIMSKTKKKTTPSPSEDMKHFLFVAQDTETFLRTITAKKLNREVQ
jgi:hypothetical protein